MRPRNPGGTTAGDAVRVSGRVRLFIFDFDGLIIDTETPDYLSWQEIYREFGQDLPMSAWADCIGARAGVFDPHGYLEGLLGKSLDRERIEARRRARFHALVDVEPVRPGVVQYIEEAERRGIRVGVASSANRNWVTAHLAKRGLLDRFACIKTVEDVQQAKPAPDLFVAVLTELGVDAAEAVAFEDSPNGVRAAKAAGLFCVAAPNPTTAQLSLDGADMQTESLASLPVDALLQRVERGAAGGRSA